MTKADIGELYNLYHLARTALDGSLSRYERKCWAVREFLKLHPGYSSKQVYLTFELCDAGRL